MSINDNLNVPNCATGVGTTASCAVGQFVKSDMSCETSPTTIDIDAGCTESKVISSGEQTCSNATIANSIGVADTNCTNTHLIIDTSSSTTACGASTCTEAQAITGSGATLACADSTIANSIGVAATNCDVNHLILSTSATDNTACSASNVTIVSTCVTDSGNNQCFTDPSGNDYTLKTCTNPGNSTDTINFDGSSTATLAGCNAACGADGDEQGICTTVVDAS